MLTMSAPSTDLGCIKKECPVYLFVRWKKGTRAFGPDISTYNGNKHVTDGDIGKMLINLIKIFAKDHQRMAVAVLYDNRIPLHDPYRDIMKMTNGVIETNRIKDFESIMYNFQLPDYLK